jgi:RNA recognition motif-containing protein
MLQFDPPAGAPAPSQVPLLFIGNIGPNTTDDDVICLFKSYGGIVSCKVPIHPRTGASKQIAYLQYEKHESASNAIQFLHGAELNRRSIRVSMARPIEETFAARERRPSPNSCRPSPNDRRSSPNDHHPSPDDRRYDDYDRRPAPRPRCERSPYDRYDDEPRYERPPESYHKRPPDNDDRGDRLKSLMQHAAAKRAELSRIEENIRLELERRGLESQNAKPYAGEKMLEYAKRR